MSNTLNKRGLAEAAIVGIVAAFLAVAFILIPPLLLLAMLLPAPFIVLVSRHSMVYSLISLVISSVLMSIIIGPVLAVINLLIFIPMALVMGDLIKKGYEEFSIIGIGTAITVLTIFLLIQIFSVALNISVINEISLILQDAIENQTEMLMSMNLQVNNIKEMVDTFMMVFPAVIVVHGILVSFINYFVSGAILKKLDNRELSLSEFSNFKLPNNIVMGSFIIILLTYLTGFFEGIYTNTLLANVLVIFTFIFFTQGLAFISYLLKKMKIIKPLRIAILIGMVIVSPLMTLISLMGLIDSVFDMRRLRTR
ncbi:DUF2232 domain-containing protein [Alkaliphilus crotonatoxidans]